MVAQDRIELPHRDFQSPALPTELSGHMAESEGLEPSMRCRTTVFKTARLPIITTLQLAETERIELSRAYTPNSLANCPLHHLGKSPCFWWARWDLNPHALLHQLLRLACKPFHHSPKIFDETE